jgi:hypothetical protein
MLFVTGLSESAALESYTDLAADALSIRVLCTCGVED